MLQALSLLFICQLVGEVVVHAAGLSFPGPVLGMGLLFVPAAVGVLQQSGLIAANWLAISAAVVVSTALTLVVTVLTFRAVARAGRP